MSHISATDARMTIEHLGKLPATERARVAKALWSEFPQREDAYLEKSSFSDVEELAQLLDHITSEDATDDATSISGFLRAALIHGTAGFGVRSVDPDSNFVTHRFPSGSYVLDNCLHSGAYGQTVYSGGEGTYKSWTAIAAAVDAVGAGWTVAYLSAELEPAELDWRVVKVCAGELEEILSRFHVIEDDGVVTVSQAVDAIMATIALGSTRKLLIVLDSVQRLVGLMSEAGGNGYYDSLRQWSEFTRQVVRISRGRVSCLVISESNDKGTDKGQQFKHAASVTVGFKHSPDQYGCVDVTITKNRRFARKEVPTLKFNENTGRLGIAEETGS